MDHLSIGQLGEDIACKYLESKDYRIIERNYWKPFGEIDIVAKESDGTLVFIEVKTLKQIPSGLAPEDNMSASKIHKTRRICEMFADQNPQLINEKRGWRIDLVAITIDGFSEIGEDSALTNILKHCTINHYENI